jgi:mannose-1-phosphate guanylyltransferase
MNQNAVNQNEGATAGLWSIVLAGGSGERLASFTRNWLGRDVPKQYCAFVGSRSMLEHTLDRASRLGAPERTVTVVAREHSSFARSQIRGGFGIGMVSQPVNRDTAPGIFLPTARILSADPSATIAIFPSDHFVYPEKRFLETVRAAVLAAEALPDKIVLLGAAPDGPEPDYGWIFPGRELLAVSARKVKSVRSFLEKPSASDAASARAEGALWNTMVMTAKVEALWRLGFRYLPEILFRLEPYLDAIGTPAEEQALSASYTDMPRRNFSSDLLQRARGEVAVVELEGVLWSDWGRPERIAGTLARIGKKPAWEPCERANTPVMLSAGIAG